MKRLLSASTAQRGMVLLVAALCTLVVAAAAGASLWLRVSADDIAAQVFGDALTPATQLQVSYDGVRADEVPPAGGAQVDAALPPRLRAHLGEPRSLVVSPEMTPEALPARSGEPAHMSVAGLPDAGGLVDVVDGRAPEPGVGRGAPPAVARSWEGPAGHRPTVVEVALQEQAARELDLAVGSWVRLGSPTYQGEMPPTPLLHVVGIFRAAHPYPSPVDDLDTLRAPGISVLPELNLVRATALAADEQTVLAARWIGPPSVRWTFDPLDTPAAADAERLVEEERRVLLQEWPSVVAADTVGAATGIGTLAQEVLEQRRASDGLVTLTLTTLAASALTALLAAAMVLASRRAPVTTVVRARGASRRRLVLTRAGEALLLVLPGLLIGLGSVSAASGRAAAPEDVAAALVAAVVCVAVVTAAQAMSAPDPGRGQGRAALADALQLGAVAVAVAVLALVLLGGALAPDDPLLLVLPPVLGAAAAVIVVRGLQLLLGVLRRATRRSRPVLPVVALSQAAAVTRRVVVASTAAVLALSSVLLAQAAGDTLHRGAERAGWEAVGADVAVATGGLRPPAVEQLAALHGVRQVAPVFTADSVSLTTRLGMEGVQLVGVAPRELDTVSESLDGLDLAPREDGRLPVVVSTGLALEAEAAQLLYAQARIDVLAVDRWERVPGVTDGGPFVLVDLAAFEAAADRTLRTFPTVLVAGAPDRDEVLATAREVDPEARVTSRAAVTRQRLGVPAVSRTTSALAVSTAVAAALAVFAVLLTVGLGAPERRRTSSVLATVGGDRRLAARIGAVALLPVLLAAGVAAAACGLVLATVAGHGFDVAGLVGTRDRLTVRPSSTTVAVLVAGWLALVLVAVAAALSPRPARPDRSDRSDPEAR